MNLFCRQPQYIWILLENKQVHNMYVERREIGGGNKGQVVFRVCSSLKNAIIYNSFQGGETK